MTLSADKVMVVVIRFGKLKEAPTVLKGNALNDTDSFKSFKGTVNGD